MTMDSVQLNNLLETSPYDLATGVKLEEYLTSQLSQKSYDFTANKALMKNYQINFDASKTDYICNILILSLMRLPNSDFLSLSYLIPAKVAKDTKISLILKLADLLEKGNFLGFWNEYLSAPESLFSTAAGFVDFIRQFMLSTLANCFKTITKSFLQQQLGLNDTSIVQFCSSSSSLVEKIDGESVIFVSNDENKNRNKVFEETLKVDEGLRLVEFLRTGRK